MNEQDKNLRRAINELPSFEPKAELWNRIEKDLDFDKTIAGALNSLPEYEPKEELWLSIEKALDYDTRKVKRKRVLTFSKYVVGIAASITFIIMGLEVLFSEKTKTPEISYTEEVVYDENRFTPAGVDKVEDEAIEFIKTTCETNNEVCDSPEFVELKSQLDELEAAISELDIAVKKYGKDHELIKTQVKLENLKSQVTKELIQKLNS